MNKIFLIIRREFLTRVRKKSFIILTILMPFLIAALVLVPAGLASIKDSDQKTVAVVDKSGKYASRFQEMDNCRFVTEKENKTEFYSDESPYDAVLVIDDDLSAHPDKLVVVSTKVVPGDLMRLLTFQVNEMVRQDKLAEHDIPGLDAILADVQTAIDIPTIKCDESGSQNDTNTGVAAGAGFFFTFIIYMFVITYGAMVMQSVMEEKTNRIVELMVSSVKPFQLMMGKIVGVGLVGLFQMAVWAGMIALLLWGISSMFGGDLQSADGGMRILSSLFALPFGEMVVMFVLFFIGGFMLYSSFYAAAGASVNSQEDSQQFVAPMVLIMVFALYAAMYSMDNVDGPLAFWASMFPLTSPIVMMVRIPFGVPLWQELLSLGILASSTLFMVWLGGKIYRVGILMYGKKPSLKEMMKWVRYK